jgi:hypothetical protein
MGLALSAVIVVPVTSVEEVISTSFTVEPGTTYGPYDNGTVYHTRIFGISVLVGEVVIEEQGVYLTVSGEHTQHLKDIYVSAQHEFVIDPAEDQYTFIFNNTDGVASSSVRFILEETWTRPVALSSSGTFIAWFGGVFLFLAGLIVLAVNRLRRQLGRHSDIERFPQIHQTSVRSPHHTRLLMQMQPERNCIFP